jgi:tetrapyrrole methylase family protein/MazG family protein
MINFISKDRYGFDDLVQLVSLLRAPGGCPWDGAQTHESIRRNFLEEAYEACEGFDRDDPALMCEELGDVLLQVLFHTDIERDAGRFCLDDVCDGVCKKLVFRHPFLFGGDASKDWEQLKQQEKGQKTPAETLDAVARSLPGLWRGEKLLKKAEKAGLIPESDASSLDTLVEKAENLQTAAPGGKDAGEKLGELLFAAAKAAVYLNVDPELALHGACERFVDHCRTPGDDTDQKKQTL